MVYIKKTKMKNGRGMKARMKGAKVKMMAVKNIIITAAMAAHMDKWQQYSIVILFYYESIDLFWR